MLYANVVLGLPIEGPFDYLVPADLENKPQGDGLASDSQSHKPQGDGLASDSQSHKPQGDGLASDSQSHKPQGDGLASDSQSHKIAVGARVLVNFRNKKEVAYVVGLNNKTKIKKLKEVSALIDQSPILGKDMLLLTKRLAEYYCCSWGEAIETALPDELRKGKVVESGDGSIFLPPDSKKIEPSPGFLFLQGQNRMPVYLREIKDAQAQKRSAIVLFSDIPEAERAKRLIEKDLGIEVFLTFRKQPKELDAWEKIREAQYCIVAGTRSSIFSPANNLGLIIVDREDDQLYKQEQVPHYHAREVALMRAQIQGARVILASHSLSLESFYLAQKEKLSYEIIPSKERYPQIKIIDVRRLAYAQRKSKSLFSKFLTDAIYACLSEKGKILLVINRKGFATAASCHNCGAALKCPRCNINLVFHFEEDKLRCHHCNFKMEAPKICPSCNTGYIKYSGIGTEKVESELARIFPQARLGADIFVATSSIVKQKGVLSFDLTGVLAIDNSLNRVDFRAAEKTFSLLTGLVGLTSKKMIIQSANANHYCFQALVKNEPQLFYKEELKARKQLNLAPFKHMILLRLRGSDLEKVKQAAADLFGKLNGLKSGSIKILSLNPGQPAKLRGNFYYQVLMRASSAKKASHFLKLHLKEWHYSGIIVSVDVDPI